MAWWQWIVLGLALLGSEMMIPADFFLVFLGISAVAVGVVDLAWPGSPIWLEWILFSVVAVASLLLFRRKLYGKLRGGSPEIAETLVGEIGLVESGIAVEGSGRIKLRGTTWAAHNVGEVAIEENARARVDAVSGLTVEVRSVKERSLRKESECR